MSIFSLIKEIIDDEFDIMSIENEEDLELQKSISKMSPEESSFFGMTIEDIYNDPNLVYNEDFISQNFILIGSGAYRFVYHIRGLDGFVLKVAKILSDSNVTVSALRDNEKEIKDFNQNSFMPRVYLYDKEKGGPRWMLVERVHVLNDENELIDYLGKKDKLLLVVLSRIAERFRNGQYSQETFENNVARWKYRKKTPFWIAWAELIYQFDKRKNTSIYWEDEDLKIVDNNDIHDAIKSKTIQDISKAISGGTEPVEINNGNIGINQAGKFVILDISR